MGYKKLQLKQVLWINPYKTKYHFKACKQPNFDNVGFFPPLNIEMIIEQKEKST